MLLILFACSSPKPHDVGPAPDAPWIPPVCYARLEEGRNPCYVCHQRGRRPHTLDDSSLQTVMDFPRPARRNGWANLFADRSQPSLSDEAIDRWVRTPNLPSQSWGATLPVDDTWTEPGAGWLPYTSPPIPGFGPAHGSWGDTFIRLPEALRTNADAARINLAILDAVLTRQSIPIAPVSEQALGVDLDLDGELSIATAVQYRFSPRDQPMRWVGTAPYPPTPGLFPLGTELLHSVRYLNPTDPVRMAPRLKELRYMVKSRWMTMAELAQAVSHEEGERAAFPDRFEPVLGDSTEGVANGRGWRLNGLIESPSGELRPQTVDELAYCIGCHGGIGRTVDSVFSAPRKQSQTHAMQASPSLPLRRGDGRLERAVWQDVAGGRFLGPAVSEGLPSPQRARAMNQAYKAIVDEQSFVYGRDVLWGLSETEVWRQVPDKQPTGVTEVVDPAWLSPKR